MAKNPNSKPPGSRKPVVVTRPNLPSWRQPGLTPAQRTDAKRVQQGFSDVNALAGSNLLGAQGQAYLKKFLAGDAATVADMGRRAAAITGLESSGAINFNQGGAFGGYYSVPGTASATNTRSDYRKNPRKRGTGGRGRGGPMGSTPSRSDTPPTYAESDTSTTSVLAAQGKAYASGRVGRSGVLAGQTSSPPSSATTGTPKTNKRRRARLKVRGQRQKSNVPKGYHINKQGRVVPNKGS